MKNYCLIGVGGWAFESSLEEVSDAPVKVFGFFNDKRKLNKTIRTFPVEMQERGRFNYLVVEEININKLDPAKRVIEYYKLNGTFKWVKPPKWKKESFLAEIVE